MRGWRIRNAWFRGAALAAALALAVPPAAAAELHPATLQAFERYVRLADARFDKETKDGPFLWVDARPANSRPDLYAKLGRGETIITKMEERENGKDIDIPDGAIHHWLGVIFIPGATVAATLRLLEDYDNHAKIFAPDVSRSKLLKREGDRFHVYLRFHKKKVLTVVLDTEHEALYQTFSPTRASSRSHTTRVNEVENHDRPDELLKPEGHDGGFLWRMNTYWRFEEKDGGTYVQCEAVSLTRDIPFLLKPIIGPYLSSVPKESLMKTLSATRNGVLHLMSSARSTP